MSKFEPTDRLRRSMPTSWMALCLVAITFVVDGPAHGQPVATPMKENVTKRHPLVIAHRGASGYLPEHTREAAALAYGLGADYIEQDLVLSRDHVPVVLHDIHLETVTNVAQRFPDRCRSDGRWYVLDFDLVELRQLQVTERVDPATGQAVFPNRFPVRSGNFQIATFAEMIQLIQGLNRSTGRDVGIYPELKRPAWHRQQQADLAVRVLEVLGEFGYQQADDRVFVQCFEAAELKRLRQRLQCALPLIQLLDDDAPTHIEALSQIAEYAVGIGPPLSLVLDSQQAGAPTPLVTNAHQVGLLVHPYTLREDALPEYVNTFERLTAQCQAAGVDGFFTDFPVRWSSDDHR